LDGWGRLRPGGAKTLFLLFIKRNCTVVSFVVLVIWERREERERESCCMVGAKKDE
jgi:hypothetical protein